MRLTWREAPAATDPRSLAATLAELGAGHGRRIAVMAPPSPLVVQAHVASRRQGWDLVALRRLPDRALGAALDEVGADLLVEGLDDQGAAGSRPADAPPRVGHVTASLAGDILGVREARAEPMLRRPEPRASGEARATGGPGTTGGPAPSRVWVWTSGTSGVPRPVPITQAMLAAHAGACRQRLADGPDAVWLGTLPMHHVAGIALLDRCLRNGSHLVLDRFDPAQAVAAIGRWGVTHASLVPTLLHRLVASAAPAPPSLRCVLLGGDAAAVDLVTRALALGWPVFTTYGLTETCGQVTTATPEEWRQKPGTSGRALPGVGLSVAEPDDLGIGQVVVQGPTVVGGRVVTGDLGRLDRDGLLFVVGRLADVIVTGGQKTDPAQVERVLREHPAVHDACVVGLPDLEWGQLVAAAIVANRTVSDDELQSHCRDRLPSHAVPRRWRRVEALPRTEGGKLQRALLRNAW